ncbi:unnamed protein product [Owenia fusiformis]|uniref:Galectin domain-containing protein n=1 Tax=Owenia fusiformis TaxID=6347 RepID=A0A8S4PDU0_OWEFU|nr:unnamed protein product [Owenia fusiformis]
MAYTGYGGQSAGAPIYNPPIPYKSPISAGLSHGKMIFITAYIPQTANRFQVNLECGMHDNADIAFHFNPRFEGLNSVIRNSRVGGGWQQEDRSGPFPFSQNQTFEMIILTQNDCYKVAVNGLHLLEFKHRLSVQQVNTLTIEGDINVQMIRFQDPTPPAGAFQPPSYNPGFPMGTVPPTIGGQPGYQPPTGAAPGFPPAGVAPGFPPAGAVPGFPPAGSGPGYPPAGGVPPGAPSGATPPPPSGPSFSYTMPYVSTIPGGMYEGRMIFISGIPNPGCDRFNINLMTGVKESDDRAFHFDARINWGSPRNQCVRNSCLSGRWGEEEKHAPYFPFTPGVNYDICILVTDKGYKVSVNNNHYIEFRHRLKGLTRINTLRIEGSTKLTNIRMQEQIRKSLSKYTNSCKFIYYQSADIYQVEHNKMNWVFAIVVLVQLEIYQGCSLVKQDVAHPKYGPVKIMKEAENVLLATFLFNTSNMDLNIGEFEVHCVFKSSIAVQEFRNTSIGIVGIVVMDSCKGSMQMVENGTYIIALNPNDCPVGSHNEHCFSLAEITALQEAVFQPKADNLQTVETFVDSQMSQL